MVWGEVGSVEWWYWRWWLPLEYWDAGVDSGVGKAAMTGCGRAVAGANEVDGGEDRSLVTVKKTGGGRRENAN